ncbi:hypothetical protein EV14_1761 [Prochlorococcus sp. MIT 0703]|nr:hypothetical protein EV12_1334 [Prochlorococcus sp. MIT 0701]KGG33113.1 hypothetical protein EV14_1761 [Prochlorococcus sp. MIT 0703]
MLMFIFHTFEQSLLPFLLPQDSNQLLAVMMCFFRTLI